MGHGINPQMGTISPNIGRHGRVKCVMELPPKRRELSVLIAFPDMVLSLKWKPSVQTSPNMELFKKRRAFTVLAWMYFWGTEEHPRFESDVKWNDVKYMACMLQRRIIWVALHANIKFLWGCCVQLAFLSCPLNNFPLWCRHDVLNAVFALFPQCLYVPWRSPRSCNCNPFAFTESLSYFYICASK